jgi:hypothetical protein
VSALPRRLAPALFVGLIALGAALWLASSGRRPGGTPDAAPAPKPVPLWVERASARDSFTRHLRPLTADDLDADTSARVLAALDRLLGRAEEPLELAAAGRMLRTLADGSYYDARFDLTLDHDRGDGGFVLAVTRPNADRSVLRGRFEDFALAALETDPGAGECAAGPGLPESFSDPDLQRRVPVTLGDVALGDVQGLLGALFVGDLEVLGELAPGGSVPQLVVDCRFPAGGGEATAAADPGADYSTRGASALLYLDREHLGLLQARVFDAGGRQVRTYTGLIYSDPARPETLKAFHVRSAAGDTETAVVLDRLELGTG